MFLADGSMQSTQMYKVALQGKNMFVHDGHLDMEQVLERFAEHFDGRMCS